MQMGNSRLGEFRIRQGLVLSIIISISFCASVPAAGEEVLATWVSGSNIADQPGVYGTKGVADPNNVPGSRDGSISWTDTAGNLWLFGGKQYISFSFFNDLWKFDGTNWTWESGSDLINQPGIYGTKGIADPNNVPGSRYESVSWTDSSGDLWLFGGYGYDGISDKDCLNDLSPGFIKILQRFSNDPTDDQLWKKINDFMERDLDAKVQTADQQ